MNTEKLDIMQTIKEGINYGLKNFFPLLLMIILYILTIWIPYLNVGTTIGLYKAVIKIGRGETIDPVAIFDKANFEGLSGFFLLLGLLYMGITVAMIFMFFPGMVMSIAWMFAVYFFLDKKVSPLKSLQLSYDSTYGNKWRIFWLMILCSLAIGIITGLLAAIPKVGIILMVIATLVSVAIMVAIDGVMYDFFSKKADEIIAERKACCHAHFAEKAQEPAEEPVNPIDEVTTEA